MAKKGESDEKVQAGTGPEEGKGAVSGAAPERETAALVGGGDRGAVEGEGAELAPAAPGTAGDGAGVVSDDQGEQDRAGVPAQGTKVGIALDDADAGMGMDAAAAAAGKADGDGAAAAAGAADGQPANLAEAARGSDGLPHDADKDGMERHDAGAFVFADNGLAAALLATDANAGQGDAEKLDGGELDAASRRPTMLEDPAFHVAVGGYSAVLDVARHLSTSREDDAEGNFDNRMSDAAFGDIAAFVRKIGKRATAEVIGQQLKILGHRASPDLSEPERIAFGAFAHVLVELDAFAATEAERARKAAETPAAVAPLPVDETTLEPVDDHFDTWR